MRNTNRLLGFTLLELLIVVAILAIVAGAVVFSLHDTQERAAEQVGQSEVLEIKQALLRFRLDTGWLPKQGPFNLSTRGGAVVTLPSYVPSNSAQLWFDSPANFWQLFENPLAGTGHPLAKWDPTTHRGWRGPYISHNGNAYVDLAPFDTTSDRASRTSQPHWTPHPDSGTPVINVPSVSDPFILGAVGDHRQFLLSRQVPSNDPAFSRRIHEYASWGRPYLLFDLDETTSARIVGLGPDGQYRTSDDITLFLLR